MRRRHADERPPIEVVGAEPRLSSLQRVSTGPPGGGRRGPRALAIVAGAAVLVVAGLALGDREDVPSAGEREGKAEATSTTRPRGSSTTRPRATTTTTVPFGPVIGGQPLAGWLLVANGSRWTSVDLDSGARREIDLPFGNPYETTAVTGGIVGISIGQAEYYDLRLDSEEGVPLGLADRVLASTRPDQVWLLNLGGEFESEPLGEEGRATLVDLQGNVIRSFDVTGAYVNAATDAGLVFERGGRAFVADESGMRPFAVGYVVGAAGRSVLLYTCDEEGRCGMELRDPDRAEGRLLELPSDALTAGYEVSRDDTGRFAVVGFGGRAQGGTVMFFDAAGVLIGSIEDVDLTFNGAPRWLPGDAGLVTVRNGRVVWIHPLDGEWVTEDVPALEGLTATDGVLIVKP